MRFTYLELENYIGIYNGMGLTRIQIDMTKCMNRTLIIRGENGSGKSTIFKAMNVFPDGNESFIPGQPAKKIISLIDHDVLYTMKFFHGIKNNGERDTTKAYISKMVNGLDIELNENGNVTSFKDILYSELSLDPNFAALSQLSLDDKGLADKKPAERKKFVNSIIESLEVYNNIYKSISKKSNQVKAMMDSLVAKLGSLGDINVLDLRLQGIEREINELNEEKDKYTKDLMTYHATINLLDPDKSIQTKYTELAVTLSESNKQLKFMMDKFYIPQETPNLLSSGPIGALEIIKIFYNDHKNKLNELLKDREVIISKYNQISKYLSDISSQLEEKKAKLATMSDESGYMDAQDKLTIYQAELNEYIEEMKLTGIDPNAFTKDEYILALETLKDIKHAVDLFRNNFDYDLIEESVSVYEELNWPIMVPLIDTTNIHHDIVLLEQEIEQQERIVSEAWMAEEAIKTLNNRPKTCTDDSCFFIRNMIEQEKKYPKGSYDKENQKLLDLKDLLDSKKKEYDLIDKKNNCINQIRLIVREIDKNGAILSRLPNGGIFSSKAEFFKHLLTGEDFSYMEKIYTYIDYSNTVDSYHITKRLVEEYKNKCLLYESKSDALEDLNSEISKLNKKYTSYTDQFNEEQDRLRELDHSIKTEEELVNSYSTYTIPELEKMCNFVNTINMCREGQQKLSESMEKINECNGHIRYVSDQITNLTNKIAPKMKERDEVKFSISQSEQYTKELEQFRFNYDRYEIIKHYSSPTKGIQLIFMELYMGRILSLANELLAFLFNGEYSIQPFVITESEFRIPCLGSGYLNDDISSMSGSQLAMISMILSFSLLHEASTKYNIIKLDEIDGPLDENNRIMFIDVMNRIMDIMNVEQCVMISHSSELQVDNSDVILLKSSQLSTDYLRGNIIWKY